MPDLTDGPIPGARYGHPNLIASDWQRLASWYERTPVPEGNAVELQSWSPPA